MTEPRTIILAEDHVQTVRVCSEALARQGLRALSVDNAAGVSELVSTERARVVLVDAAISGGDVVELCRRLRRDGVGVVLLIPPRFNAKTLENLRSLAEECVQKPFDADDLARRVTRLAAGPAAGGGPGGLRCAEEGTGGGPAVANAALELSGGRRVAGCILEREIGRGATSVVYLARHATLDIPVALKLMPVILQRWDAEDCRRFIRGARAAVRIQHPNVVPVLNAGEEDGCLFLVQRYVEGETLQARIERLGPQPEGAVREILRQIASGLGAAHRLDIVHRDVKPANIILSASGQALLTDFGLARGAGDREISSGSAIVGTPLYMSPEQCAGGALDGRSDLYSLGASAYHAATGRPPISGASPVAVLRNHVETMPDPPHHVARSVSRGFSDVLMRLLAKDPDDRYRDAEELIAAL